MPLPTRGSALAVITQLPRVTVCVCVCVCTRMLVGADAGDMVYNAEEVANGAASADDMLAHLESVMQVVPNGSTEAAAGAGAGADVGDAAAGAGGAAAAVPAHFADDAEDAASPEEAAPTADA